LTGLWPAIPTTLVTSIIAWLMVFRVTLNDRVWNPN
jgi:hypothetical protein